MPSPNDCLSHPPETVTAITHDCIDKRVTLARAGQLYTPPTHFSGLLATSSLRKTIRPVCYIGIRAFSHLHLFFQLLFVLQLELFACKIQVSSVKTDSKQKHLVTSNDLFHVPLVYSQRAFS